MNVDFRFNVNNCHDCVVKVCSLVILGRGLAAVKNAAHWFSVGLLVVLQTCSAAALGKTEQNHGGGPIQANSSINVRKLLAIRDINGLSLSPSGDRLVFQIREKDIRLNAYRQRWISLDLKSGEQISYEGGEIIDPQRLDGIAKGVRNGDPRTFEPAWSPDGRHFAYIASTDGDYSLWVASRDSSEARSVSQRGRDLQSFAWSPEGDKLLYRTGPDKAALQKVRDAEGCRGFLYDERFVPARSRLPLWIKTPDGQETDVWVSELNSGNELKIRRATEQEIKTFDELSKTVEIEGEMPWLAGFSNDRTKVAWVASAPGDGMRQWDSRLRAKPANGGEIIECNSPECTAGYDENSNGVWFRDLWWSHSGTRLYFAKLDSIGRYSLFEWSLTSNTVRPILRTNGNFNYKSMDRGLACDINDNDSLFCIFETHTRPAHIVSISMVDGSMETVFDPNEFLAEVDLPKLTRIQYTSPSGVEAWGYWVAPQGVSEGKKVPAVVIQYDCEGFALGGTGDEFPVYAFAASGIGVFCHDSYVNQKNRIANMDRPMRRLQRYKENVESINEGLDLLIDKHSVDAKRVGITGLSNGSELMHYAIVHFPKRYAAAAAAGGMWDAALYAFSGRNWQKVSDDEGFGYSGSVRDRISHAVSVLENIDKIETPLLIQAAEYEFVYALPQITAYEQAVKPAELIVFPDEGHIKRYPAHLYHLYYRYLQWFRFWLQHEEVNDPVDPEQYVRWRKMREDHCASMKEEEIEDLPIYCESRIEFFRSRS